MVNSQDFLKSALWLGHFPFLESSHSTHFFSIYISPESISSIVPWENNFYGMLITLMNALAECPNALDRVMVRTKVYNDCETQATSAQISNYNNIYFKQII